MTRVAVGALFVLAVSAGASEQVTITEIGHGWSLVESVDTFDDSTRWSAIKHDTSGSLAIVCGAKDDTSEFGLRTGLLLIFATFTFAERPSTQDGPLESLYADETTSKVELRYDDGPVRSFSVLGHVGRSTMISISAIAKPDEEQLRQLGGRSVREARAFVKEYGEEFMVQHAFLSAALPQLLSASRLRVRVTETVDSRFFAPSERTRVRVGSVSGLRFASAWRHLEPKCRASAEGVGIEWDFTNESQIVW